MLIDFSFNKPPRDFYMTKWMSLGTGHPVLPKIT